MAYDLLDLEMVRMIFDILYSGWAYNDLASSHIRRLICNMQTQLYNTVNMIYNLITLKHL